MSSWQVREYVQRYAKADIFPLDEKKRGSTSGDDEGGERKHDDDDEDEDEDEDADDFDDLSDDDGQD